MLGLRLDLGLGFGLGFRLGLGYLTYESAAIEDQDAFFHDYHPRFDTICGGSPSFPIRCQHWQIYPIQ